MINWAPNKERNIRSLNSFMLAISIEKQNV